MKKMPFIILALFITAAGVLSGCTLPARIEAPIPTAGDIENFLQTAQPEAHPTATSELVLPELPTPTEAGQAPLEPTPTTAPPVVTATPEPTLPPTPEPTQPAVSTTAPETAAAGSPEPGASQAFTATRIAFSPGGTSATVRGDLAAGQTAHYVLQANSGQTMRLDIWSPNGDVFAAVENASTGQALLNTSERMAKWSGTLPAAGDYNIHVAAGGGASSYSLTVEIPAAGGATPAAATPAAASTPTASPTGYDPYKSLGRPNFIDEMNSQSRTNWAARDGTLPNTTNLRIALENNRVYVTGKTPGFKTWYFSWVSLKNAFVELTVETGACSGKDAYGLVLRGPEHRAGYSHGYVVAFSCDGAYQIYRIDGADPFTAVTLVDWTPSSQIRSGPNQSNVLGVRASGSTYTVYANGEKIAEITDNNYLEGRIGFYVAPANTANFTYRPVRLAAWKLE